MFAGLSACQREGSGGRQGTVSCSQDTPDLALRTRRVSSFVLPFQGKKKRKEGNQQCKAHSLGATSARLLFPAFATRAARPIRGGLPPVLPATSLSFTRHHRRPRSLPWCHCQFPGFLLPWDTLALVH